MRTDELEAFFRGFLADDLNADAQDGSIEAMAQLLAELYDQCKGGQLNNAIAVGQGNDYMLPPQLRWHVRMIVGTCVNNKAAGGAASSSASGKCSVGADILP